MTPGVRSVRLCKISSSKWSSGRANQEEKEAATETIKFPITSDYADGHQYSSDQSVNENENYPPSFTGLHTLG
jgi:hypothetical protein